MSFLLGIDNGGTATKAALFDAAGRVQAVVARAADLHETRPGWAERDMETLWRTTAAAVRQALEAAGRQPEAVACTGHGNGLYLIDGEGRPVRPAIGSGDTRAQGYIEAWRRDGTAERIRPLTTQSLWPGQPNALLRWLADHEPQALECTRWVLMAKDYIRFRLTGEVWAELTDFSGASLVNVPAGRYDTALLAAFGIEAWQDRLPPLRGSLEVLGHVTREAAAETGIRAGTPVAGGMFDIDACALASGMLDDSVVAMVAGTWGNTLFLDRTPATDPELFMSSCYTLPGWFLMLEGSPTSAANLDWVMRECGVAGYGEANRLVASGEAAVDDPLFLPFLHGSHAGPHARAAFLDLRARHTRAHLVRAVCEGVAFAQRWHYERVLRLRPRPASIRLSGGAARSTPWVQMFADVLDTPVEIPAGEELGALGAAIGAGIAAGVFADAPRAVAAMTRVAARHDPDARRAAVYDERYPRYRQALAALQPYWNSHVQRS